MGRLGELGVLGAYLAGARLALALPSRLRLRSVLFALVNLAAVVAIWQGPTESSPRTMAARMGAYLAVALVHYVLVAKLARAPGRWPWVAFAFPIALLVALKYAAPLWHPLVARASLDPAAIGLQLSLTFVGFSFMAFRMSGLVLEVSSGALERPDLWSYLGYCFFVPTLAVGPINPASVHLQSLDAPSPELTPVSTCLLRILVGAVKYLLLGGALAHLTFTDLVLDGHPHHRIDFVVSSVAYYLYLYCNFSGFCDMAIGASGLLGIEVVENFRAPLLARNIKDFWSRWHISLSEYVRSVLFTPLSIGLARRWGAENVPHAIAAALFVTFLLTGVWHGAGLNFALFGLLHGGAMVVHHYYTQLLRKKLGRERLKAYEANPWVKGLAVAATFAFVTLTFVVFANDLDSLKRLFQVDAGGFEERFGGG
jgi:D-alanyl-lipoteichoic acid acyltransferase DltB (MBOAT superfamily)